MISFYIGMLAACWARVAVQFAKRKDTFGVVLTLAWLVLALMAALQYPNGGAA